MPFPIVIENKNFVPHTRFEINPLMISTCGGGGHLSAIKGIIEFLKKNYAHRVHFTSYLPFLLKDKPPSATGNQAMQALTLMKRPHLGPAIRYMMKPFSIFSTLPDKDLVLAEMDALDKTQSLNDEGKEPKPREYSDLLYDVDPAGCLAAAMWNVAIAQDNSPLLMKFNSMKDETDKRNYATVFNYYITLLNNAKKPYTEIICTQTMSLPALCDVVIEYNKHTDKPIIIHEYMSDLPTRGATHFFDVLSRLTEAQQKVIKLYAVGMNHEVLEQFFPHGTYFSGIYNVSRKENPMVRPGFKDPSLNKSHTFHEKTTLDLKNEGLIEIKADEPIASIMLGSQASRDTVAYVESFLAKGIKKVFVFGGKKKNISHEIDLIIKRHPAYKDNIIPLGFMDDTQMMPLMTRSNFLVMRGGGLSVMEQMAIPHHPEQTILFHHVDASLPTLTSGITWEDGNIAELMQVLSRLSVHTQKTCPKHARCDITEAQALASFKKLSHFYCSPDTGQKTFSSMETKQAVFRPGS